MRRFYEVSEEVTTGKAIEDAGGKIVELTRGRALRCRRADRHHVDYEG